jgi:hypothetical protein
MLVFHSLIFGSANILLYYTAAKKAYGIDFADPLPPLNEMIVD